MKEFHNNPSVERFEAFVRDSAFPCVGAKSALARDQITFCHAEDIRTSSSDEMIVGSLQAYAQRCSADGLFLSFVVLFHQTPPLTEDAFEKSLWQRLQALHDKDVKEYAWDSSVSADPDSPHFSMSIGGKGFYVVGLHPNASRPARRFEMPALVFNLHSQFEMLRDSGSYERIRQAILARDVALAGTINPMLAEHGKSSEARQYSGRVVDATWKCPFHARHTEANE